MRSLGVVGILLLLLLVGFVLYDVFDFALGAWMLFGSVLGLAVGRLLGVVPGIDLDIDN